MTVSLYYKISPLKTSSEIKDYLDSIGLQMFNCFFNDPYTGEDAYFIIAYIIRAYDQDSPFIIARADRRQEKNDICDSLKMPEYIRTWVTELELEDVRNIIVEYVDKFAGEEYRNYLFNKMQLDDLRKMITKKESKDADKQFSIKDHTALIRETNRLAKEIEAIEKILKDRISYNHMVKDEVAKARKKTQSGVKMENSEHIK